MDLIYKCVPVTIIAAAGIDCQYGMSGISSCRRYVLEPFVLDCSFTFGVDPQEDHCIRRGEPCIRADVVFKLSFREDVKSSRILTCIINAEATPTQCSKALCPEASSAQITTLHW